MFHDCVLFLNVYVPPLGVINDDDDDDDDDRSKFYHTFNCTCSTYKASNSEMISVELT